MMLRNGRLLGVRLRWIPIYLVVGILASLYFAQLNPFEDFNGGNVYMEEHAGRTWAITYVPDPNRHWVLVFPTADGKDTEELKAKLQRMRKPLLLGLEQPSWVPRPWDDVPPAEWKGLRIMRQRGGWPMHCVMSDWYRNDTGTPAYNRWIGAVKLGRLPELPIRPVWPGAVVNVLFFATAAVGLHELLAWPWRAWKRLFARVNQLCEKCKYDRKGLAANAPCPECGLVP